MSCVFADQTTNIPFNAENYHSKYHSGTTPMPLQYLKIQREAICTPFTTAEHQKHITYTHLWCVLCVMESFYFSKLGVGWFVYSRIVFVVACDVGGVWCVLLFIFPFWGRMFVTTVVVCSALSWL